MAVKGLLRVLFFPDQFLDTGQRISGHRGPYGVPRQLVASRFTSINRAPHVFARGEVYLACHFLLSFRVWLASDPARMGPV